MVAIATMTSLHKRMRRMMVKYLNVMCRVLQKYFSKKLIMKKRIDVLSSIVERIKIRNSESGIDDVATSAKRQNVKYKVYY